MLNFSLNFGGFYENYNAFLVEQAAAYYFDMNDENGEVDPEKIWYLGADVWHKIENLFCVDFVNALNDELDTNIFFDELISPKAYNFQTDIIWAAINKKDILKLFKYIKKNNLKNNLFNLIKNRSKSYDGFIAFYSYNEYFKKDQRGFLVEMMFDVILKSFDYPVLDEFYFWDFPAVVQDAKGYYALKG